MNARNNKHRNATNNHAMCDDNSPCSKLDNLVSRIQTLEREAEIKNRTIENLLAQVREYRERINGNDCSKIRRKSS